MTIVKICIVAVIGVLLALKLKNIGSPFETYVSLCISMVILFFALDKLKTVAYIIEKLQNYITVDSSYILILFKLMGIAYICEFASNLCKDSGYGVVASQVEIVGKLSMMVISIPVIFALLDTVTSFLT